MATVAYPIPTTRTATPRATPRATPGKAASICRNPVFLALSVALATAVPLLSYVEHKFSLAPVSLFEDDTFYYLAIAQKDAAVHFPTFDGVHVTNGFHPVWEALLVALTRSGWLSSTNLPLALHRLALLDVGVLTLACGLIGWVLARSLRTPWLALLAVCPGYLWFVEGLVTPGVVANWSFANGMESAVELLFFGAALALYPGSLTSVGARDRDAAAVPHPDARFLAAYVCFAAMVLSRLDDVFFLLPLFYLARSRRSEVGRLTRWTAIAVPSLLLLAYVVYNRVTAGSFLPSSGAAKAGLALGENLSAAFHMVIPNYWDTPGPQHLINFSLYTATFERAFEMLAPPLVCGLYLYWRQGPLSMLSALCIGVLLKALYNLVNVHLFSQGHWYYAVNLMTANLCIAVCFDAVLGAASRSKSPPFAGFRSAFPVVASLVLTMVVSNAFIDSRLRDIRAQHNLRIVNAGPELRQRIEGLGDHCFLEFNDGLLSYATGLPAMAGLGLALDAEANEAHRDGHMLDLATSRGCSLAIATGTYRAELETRLPDVQAGKQIRVLGLRPEEFQHYTFEPVFTDPALELLAVRVVKR